MPRVPSYDNFTALPTPQPQVNARVPDAPDVAGRQMAQMGQAVKGLGGEVGRIALDMQQQANQVRINDAMNRAMQAKLRRTYDPEEGFSHLRGDAALTRPDGKPLDEEWSGKLSKDIDDIEAGLGNDAQRQAFRQQANQMLVQFRGAVTSHVAKEFGDYQVSVQDGTIATARDQMGMAWGDAEAVGQSVSAIKAAVAEKGRLRGWSAQQVEASMREVLAPAHATVIGSALDAGKLDYAREYFKQVGAELTPAARLTITKALDAGDFEARTQDAADRIYAKNKGDTAAALAEVRATLSGKDEDAVVTRIKAMDAERVQLRERVQKDASDEAWRIYAQTGRMPPPSVQTAMDGKDLAALRRTAQADAEARAAKTEVKTDPNVYYALTIAAAQDASGFKQEDLRRYFDKLSPGDRKHFIDLQARASKPEEADDISTLEQQKRQIVDLLKLDKDKAGMFSMEADKALRAAQAAKGTKLTDVERQKVLDRLVLQGETPGRVWGTNTVRAFEASAQGRTFTPAWNDDQKRKATAALQRQGIKTPTAQQVEAVLRATYGTQ
jgi:hypothetical protein